MSHEKAQQVLAQAATGPARTEAIRTAMREGMSLAEIEAYLDWLEQVRGTMTSDTEPIDDPPPR